MKARLEGEKLIERLTYRKAVAQTLALKNKVVVAKNEVYRKELLQAKNLGAEVTRNKKFGFTCLHYSVSESSQYVRIKVEHKTSSNNP